MEQSATANGCSFPEGSDELPKGLDHILPPRFGLTWHTVAPEKLALGPSLIWIRVNANLKLRGVFVPPWWPTNQACTELTEGSVGKSLKKFLKKHLGTKQWQLQKKTEKAKCEKRYEKEIKTFKQSQEVFSCKFFRLFLDGLNISMTCFFKIAFNKRLLWPSCRPCWVGTST